MSSPARRRPPSDADLHARLSARIEALEDRVRRLEVLVRGAVAAARSRGSGSASGKTVGKSMARVRREPSAPRVKGRARPRCPGCTLELPSGPRGESCVWCGFQFDAVRLRKRKG